MPNVLQQIQITLTDDGQVAVNGPLENKMLFYGLIEVAKETCYDYNKQAERRIQPAPMGLVVPRA